MNCNVFYNCHLIAFHNVQRFYRQKIICKNRPQVLKGFFHIFKVFGVNGFRAVCNSDDLIYLVTDTVERHYEVVKLPHIKAFDRSPNGNSADIRPRPLIKGGGTFADYLPLVGWEIYFFLLCILSFWHKYLSFLYWGFRGSQPLTLAVFTAAKPKSRPTFLRLLSYKPLSLPTTRKTALRLAKTAFQRSLAVRPVRIYSTNGFLGIL